MDLILWRHADAEDGSPDEARRLTSKGARQAEKMAAWLARRLPDRYLVLSSPAVRSQQTARALTPAYKIVQDLAVGGSVAGLLQAAGWPDAKKPVVIVGHQPTLGCTAAFLMAGEEVEWSVKKGAVWWFSNRVRIDEHQTVLRAVIGPDFA